MKLKLFTKFLMMSVFAVSVSVSAVALADDFSTEAAPDAELSLNSAPAWFNWRPAGYVPGPIHGAPNAWNPRINHCGTEYPRGCNRWQRGERCYVNNGYYWDNLRGHNWFRSYVCQ